MTYPSNATPALSVILVVGAQRERAGAALASLLRQTALEKIEVILVDCGSGSTPALPEADHPSVHTHSLPNVQSYGSAMAEGVARAHAPVVAFLEEHALACGGWAQALLRAHQGPWAGVGCLVYPGERNQPVSMAIGLLNDFWWSWPDQGGERAAVRGHNASYKREILLGLGSELDDMLEYETLLHRRLQDQGEKLYQSTGARIVHRNDTTLAAIAGVYTMWNRSYAAKCRRDGIWPTRTILVKILGSPLSPFVRWFRTIRLLVASGRIPLAQTLRLAPIFLLAHAASAWGQLLGLILGEGVSRRRFLHHELNAFRNEPDWDWEAA